MGQSQMDDDLDDLLEDTLNDFAREEARPNPAPPAAPPPQQEAAVAEVAAAAFAAELQRELEKDLGAVPPELDEFRRALVDSFAQLAASAAQPPQPPGGALNEGDSQLLEGFLRDVLSRDVLYEPLRDLRNLYPDWLSKHRGELSAEDASRYDQQLALLVRVCTAYETNAPFDEVAALMEQISTLGAAPAELLTAAGGEAAAAAAAAPGQCVLS